MEPASLPSRIRALLEQQVAGFQEAMKLHNEFIDCISSSSATETALSRLRAKDAELDGIRRRNQDSRELMERWISEREQYRNDPDTPAIQQSLELVSGLAESLRSSEEQLMALLSGVPGVQAGGEPSERLAAFRALR